MELDLPRVAAFLCCNQIQQDVLTKNYDLRGVFQGFAPPAYPFGADFMSLTRFSFEGQGEFQMDLSLFDEKGAKVSESLPRKISFGELPNHDLITAWRVLFPGPGTYRFKVFCNNLNLGDYPLLCR